MSQKHPYTSTDDDYQSHQDTYADSYKRPPTTYQPGIRSSSQEQTRSTASSNRTVDSSVNLPRKALSFLHSCGLDPSDLAHLAELPEHLITVETLPSLLLQVKERKLSSSSSSRPSTSQPLDETSAHSWDGGSHTTPVEYPIDRRVHPVYPLPPEQVQTWQDRWGNPRQTSSLTTGVSCSSSKNSSVPDYSISMDSDPYCNTTESPKSSSHSFVDSRPRPLLSLKLEPPIVTPTKNEASDFNCKVPMAFPHVCQLCDVSIHSSKDWFFHIQGSEHAKRQLELVKKYPKWDQTVESARNESSEVHTVPTRKEASDFNGVVPPVFPYLCVLCNITVFSEKDWSSHVASGQHAQSQLDLMGKYPVWDGTVQSSRRNDGQGSTDTRDGTSKGNTSYKKISHVKDELCSRVVSFTPLPAGEGTTSELTSIAKRFGAVKKSLFLTNQGYVEMSCLAEAKKLVEYYSSTRLKLKGKLIKVTYSHEYNSLREAEVNDTRQSRHSNTQRRSSPAIHSIQRDFSSPRSVRSSERTRSSPKRRHSSERTHTSPSRRHPSNRIPSSPSRRHSSERTRSSPSRRHPSDRIPSSPSRRHSSDRTYSSPSRRHSSDRTYSSPSRRHLSDRTHSSPCRRHLSDRTHSSPSRRHSLDRTHSSPSRRHSLDRTHSSPSRRHSSDRTHSSPSRRHSSDRTRSSLSRGHSLDRTYSSPKRKRLSDRAHSSPNRRNSSERTHSSPKRRRSSQRTHTSPIRSSLERTHSSRSHQVKEREDSPKSRESTSPSSPAAIAGTTKLNTDPKENKSVSNNNKNLDSDSDLEGLEVIADDGEELAHDIDDYEPTRSNQENLSSESKDVTDTRTEEVKNGEDCPKADTSEISDCLKEDQQFDEHNEQDITEEDHDFSNLLENCVTLDEFTEENLSDSQESDEAKPLNMQNEQSDEEPESPKEECTSKTTAEPNPSENPEDAVIQTEEEHERETVTEDLKENFGNVLEVKNLPSAEDYTDLDFLNIIKRYGDIIHHVLFRSYNKGFVEMALASDAERVAADSKKQDIALRGNVLKIKVSEKYCHLPENGCSVGSDSDDEEILKEDMSKSDELNGNTDSSKEADEPVGTEFVRPVVGYFCNLCNVIYATEEEAKDEHCRSPAHREKVKEHKEQSGSVKK